MRAAVGSSGTLAVDGLAVLGDSLGQLGHWDEALAPGAEAQAVATETGIAWDRHIANYHLARTLLARGDPSAATPLIEWNIAFGENAGLPMVSTWHLALLGHASLLSGRVHKAIGLLDRAITGCAGMRLKWTQTYALLVKAEASLISDRNDPLPPATEALRLSRIHGYHAFAATALRLLAVGATPADPAAAGRHLAAARKIASARAIAPELSAIAAAEARLREPTG
jgi:hypothetical protein